MDTVQDPFGVLLKLVKRNYKKLMDARATFEVIRNRMAVIDNPQELVEFLSEHLKPKDVEKKLNGEVFTPPHLIQKKFDQLTLADPLIWSDPSKKFLDPANGIGNYPALAYQRLMEGLKVAIPDMKERKKHILENMLYQCELNPKNVEISRKLFDPEGEYALNLYQGSYLDLNPMDEWKVETFDVIFGNPPYNAPGKGASGNTIWQNFVVKSLNLLSKGGYLVFVHPNGWRKPNTETGKFSKLFKLMAHDAQLLYLSIHGAKEGKTVFHCGTRFDWYILQNRIADSPTEIRDEMNEVHSVDLRLHSWLPNYKIKEITELCVRQGDVPCPIIYDRTAYGADKKDRMSSKQDDTFSYPCIHSTPKKGVRYMYSKYNDRGHFGISKVIFGESGIHLPVLDYKGEYGITHGAMGIQIQSKEDGENLISYLQTKEFKMMLSGCMFSSFRIDWNLFKEFRDGFWRPIPLAPAPAPGPSVRIKRPQLAKYNK